MLDVEISRREPQIDKEISPERPITSLNWPSNKEFLEVDVSFHSGARKKTTLKLVLWSWMAASIDALVLFSLSCFTVVMFSLIMKTPAKEIFRILSINNVTELFFVAFFFSAWSYLVVMRLFLGASIGEWSCHLRLGQPAQRIRRNYVLKIIVRTTLILATGVVVLPLLSLFLKRDLAGDITGIFIYSLNS